MKKILLLFIFAAAAVCGAGAQGIERMRTELAVPDAHSRAQVKITEEPDAAWPMKASDNAAAREVKVTGYRVSLFRDNSQTAGDNARAVAAQFRQLYPGIPVSVAYRSPYFTVTAGNFVDKVDAIALWGKALGTFPKAVVVQETLSVADIVAQQKTVPGQEEIAEPVTD